MEKEIISVIVPVYNMEKYLPKCIDSILNQTYKNIEAIFINDGSTDNSLKILENYYQKDQRVRIINKKNEGTGAARNNGIKVSKGKYITFLDSDDWYEENFIEKLYKNLKENDSDIAMCNPKMVYDNKEKNQEINTYYFKSLNLKKEPEKILRVLAMPISCSKLYKKEIIVNNNIFYPNYSFAEDVEFLYKLFLNIKKISKVEDYLYNYYQRDTSATKKIKEEAIEQVCNVLNNIEKYIKNKFPDNIEIFYQYKIQFIYSVSITLLSGTNNPIMIEKINKQNNLLIKGVKNKIILKNFKILIYYIAIRLNKVLEISNLISLLKKGKINGK